MTTHCEYDEKAPREPAFVLKPPVESVVSEWLIASNSVISPTQRKRTSTTVRAR